MRGIEIKGLATERDTEAIEGVNSNQWGGWTRGRQEGKGKEGRKNGRTHFHRGKGYERECLAGD